MRDGPITTVYLACGGISTVTAAAAVKRSIDKAVERALNEPDSVFALKEEQTTALKAFAE